MASARVILFLACLACLDLLSLQQNAVMVAADVHIGSCVWGAVNYTSNCNKECKRRGYKGGHCGSFANVNCWCEKK